MCEASADGVGSGVSLNHILREVGGRGLLWFYGNSSTGVAAEDRDLWRKITMTIARALRADGPRWQGSLTRKTGISESNAIPSTSYQQGLQSSLQPIVNQFQFRNITKSPLMLTTN